MMGPTPHHPRMKGKAVRVHPAQVQGYEAGVGRLELTALAEDFVWQDVSSGKRNLPSGKQTELWKLTILLMGSHPPFRLGHVQ